MWHTKLWRDFNRTRVEAVAGVGSKLSPVTQSDGLGGQVFSKVSKTWRQRHLPGIFIYVSLYNE